MSSPSVQGWNKGKSVLFLDLVLTLALEFPVGVVDEHDDAWPDTVVLNKHFFLFFQVVFPEFLNYWVEGQVLSLQVQVDLLFVVKYEFQAPTIQKRWNFQQRGWKRTYLNSTFTFILFNKLQ